MINIGKKGFFALICIYILGLFNPIYAQDKKAYTICANDKIVTYSELLEACLGADIVFFGELHNNPIGHWLQFELTKDLFAKHGEHLVLGAEMFESDNQVVLDEYLNDYISEAKFESECRLWDNYKTDYKPLVLFAKEKKLKFIATNIPRRYASMVNNKGIKSLDELTKQARKWIAPLPFQVDLKLSSYKSLLDDEAAPSQESVNFVFAQAVKDATMAHFILENFHKKTKFIHFNGKYHSDLKQGIVHYINQNKSNLNIVNISMDEYDDINSCHLGEQNIANFIIQVTENMTKTY
jgi:uncharacterized iron-regulated protein